jgi:alkanesulfonate monooxygenase SsuD/methylene tetrahydromethanopterin reductase-like flavin-dependent oxidoreductase (luciferase family)
VRYSIMLPISPRRPEQLVPFANIVKWTRAERLWQGHGMLLDSHHMISWLAGIGIRVPAGFGVSLTPLRSPYQAAMETRSVATATGQPVVAGFGPGGRALQAGVMGKPYGSQIRACREYLTIVRRLLAGGHVQAGGDFFTCDLHLADFPARDISLGLGVLREKMARLAGEIADVAITWMAPASYLDNVLLPAMRDADRALDTPPKVTAYVPVALSAPDRDAEHLTAASCGAHIQLPHYQDMFRRAGIHLTGDITRDAPALRDGGVFLYGTAEEIHQRLAEFAALGVDEVVLNATGVGLALGATAAAQDLLELLDTAPT